MDMMAEAGAMALNVFLAVFGSPALITLFVLLLGVAAGLLFLFATAVGVWLGAALWAALAGGPTDAQESGFDDSALLAPLAVAGIAIVEAVESLVAIGVTAAQSAGGAVLGNPLLTAVAVAAFAFTFVWTQFHAELLVAAAGFYNCFFAPLWRTLVLPLVDLVAFVVTTALLPLLVALRRIVVSVTTSAALRALEASFDAVALALRGILLAAQAAALALVAWLRVDAGGGSPLVVGPDLFPAAAQLGSSIADLSAFGDALCEPLAEPLIDPFFDVFRGEPFALALNATAGVAPALVTQAVARPIVESLQNSAANPDAPLAETIQRPNFNASIDLALVAVRRGTEFGDSFVSAGFDALLNLLRDLIGLPLPPEPRFPTRSYLTLTVAAPAELFVLQPAKLALNWLVNVDLVFTTADGHLFWRLDDVFDALRDYRGVSIGLFEFGAEWFEQLGEAVEPLARAPVGADDGLLVSLRGADVRRVNATRRDVRAFAVDDVDGGGAAPLALEGELLKAGLDYVASTLKRSACTIETSTEALIQLVRLPQELVVGTVYTAVSELANDATLNPLLFAQRYFGDGSAGALKCAVISGQFDFIFGRAPTRDCLEDAEFEALCSETAATGIVPEIVFFDPVFELLASQPELDQMTEFCSSNPMTCLTAVSAENVVRNEFRVAYDAFVAPLTCTAQLIDALLPDVLGFFSAEALATAAGQVLVAPALVVTDIVVHVDRVVTTPYIARCVQFDSVFDEIADLAEVLGTDIRQLGSAFSEATGGGQVFCEPADGLRSSNLFCCLGNLVESFTALVTEPLRQVVTIFRVVIEAIALGVGGESDPDRLRELLDTLTFETTFDAIEALIFDAVCFPMQIVPGDISCTPAPNADERVLRDELTRVASVTVSDITLLVPKQLLNGTVALIDAVGAAAGGQISVGVNELIDALMRPYVDLFQNAATGAGELLTCVEPGNGIGDALIALGQFLGDLGDEFIVLYANFILLIIQIVFGLFELVFNTCGQAPCTALLTSAFDTIGLIIVQFFLIIFGQDFVCGLQDAGCFFTAAAASPTLLQACNDNNFTFTFCPLQAGRPSSVTCEFAQQSKCFFGGCPDSPFGCCGPAAFPERNSDGDEFAEFIAAGDVRDQCTPWIGVVDADEDDDSTAITEACRPFLGIAEDDDVEPYSAFFFDNSTNARLACSFGQSSDPDCDLFPAPDECFPSALVERESGRRRKRDTAVYEELDYERHRGEVLSASYCARWLEEYGMGRARRLFESGAKYRKLASADDRAALRCYRAAMRDSAGAPRFDVLQAARFDALDRVVRKIAHPDAIAMSVSATLERARPAAQRIYEERRVRLAGSVAVSQRRRGGGAMRLGSRMTTLAEQLRAATTHYHARIAPQMRDAVRPLTTHMVSAFARDHSTMARIRLDVRADTLLAHAVAAAMHASDVVEHGVGTLHRALHAAPRAAVRIGRGHAATAARTGDATGVALLAVRDLAALYGRRLDAGLRQRLAEWTAPARRPAPVRRRKRQTPPVVLPPNTLPALGVHQCNTSVQVVCTGCALFDDFVFETESAINRTADFYTGETTGFGLVLGQLERTIDHTLVDPTGSDTFATLDKRTPFILERLFNVRWFWQWDYSEFRTIVNDALASGDEPVGEDDLADETERESERVAAAAGRDDLDNVVYDALKPLVQPAVNFLESLVASTGVTDALDVAGALAERYLLCDYDRAMYCEEPASVGLFDAAANMVLLFLIVGVLVSVLPGSLILFVALSALAGTVFVYGTLWVAYGASPLCTLPTLVGGVGALPTCTLMDASRLLQELTPECPFVPPALIVPGDPDADTLCATCGSTPALRSCAEAAGFLDGRDNLFFSLASIFPQTVVDQIGAALDFLVRGSAAVAARYTPALLAELRAAGQIGAVCNLITLGNLLTLAAVVALAALVTGTLVALLVGLGGALIVLTAAVLYVVVLLYQQQYTGLVLRTGDSKLKLA